MGGTPNGLGKFQNPYIFYLISLQNIRDIIIWTETKGNLPCSFPPGVPYKREFLTMEFYGKGLTFLIR